MKLWTAIRKRWTTYLTGSVIAAIAAGLLFTPLSSLYSKADTGTPLALPQAQAQPLTTNYLVKNGQFYDNQTMVTLHGINWFGFDTPDHIEHGLWARNWYDMLDQIQALGFNALRIPVCAGTLDNSLVGTVDYKLNPDLVGLRSMQALDLFVAQLEQRHLYYMFDFHSYDCGGYTELWYTPDHPESQWIGYLTDLAKRYKDNDYFVGLDLKNEPHGAATWGTGNVLTDWNLAAERAGKAVLAVNKKITIFVEGIHTNPSCITADGNWWGGTIEPYNCTPISIKSIPANKLVLSPHIYGPSLYNQSYYSADNFPLNLSGIWYKQFGKLAQTVAVIPGEWGGKYSGSNGKDKQVLDSLAQFFINNHMCSSFYWAWNPNSHDVGGVLLDNWQSIDEGKLHMLQTLFTDCSAK